MKLSVLRNWYMLPRSTQPELLDDDNVSGQDLQENLHDLQWLNRILGSRWLILKTVRRLWRQAGRPRYWRVLDIGAGAGDIPRCLQRWGRRRGIHLTLVAVDSHWHILHCAQAACRGKAVLPLVQANALQLPFRPQSFDVVMCSTMLHHLGWHEGIMLLQAMAQVTRASVVVNDLVRSRVHYYGARLLLALVSRNRLTRHDGPLSVLRAYSRQEIRDMARLAGLSTARVTSALGYRFLLTYRRADRETATGPLAAGWPHQ